MSKILTINDGWFAENATTLTDRPAAKITLGSIEQALDLLRGTAPFIINYRLGYGCNIPLKPSTFVYLGPIVA